MALSSFFALLGKIVKVANIANIIAVVPKPRLFIKGYCHLVGCSLIVHIFSSFQLETKTTFYKLCWPYMVSS
jgi:hypothetical protein